MRFSTSAAILALPLLATAQNPLDHLDQYKAKFQNFLGSFAGTGAAGGAVVPEAAEVPQQKPIVSSNTESAATGTVATKKVERLTLSNWKDTLYAPVQPAATTPEEWWVLVTGGNKTCFGMFESSH